MNAAVQFPKSQGVLWTLCALAVLVALPAQAQSDALLEAVRLHDPSALARAGTERKACEKSKCEALARLTLLEGYLTLSEGDAEGAQALLSSRAAPEGTGPWREFYLGEADFYRRAYKEAAKDFERAVKDAPESLRLRAVARLGESLLAAKNPAAALPHLEQAANALGTPELYFQRAQAREATGNADGARADRVLLAVKFPAHPYGVESLARLTAQKPAYRFSFEERRVRSQAFLDAGKAAEALEELAAIDRDKLARGGTAKATLAHARALALLAEGKDAEAEPWLNKALEGPRSIAADAAMVRARRALRGSDRAKARALLADVAKKYPKEPVADDALYLAAWIDLQEMRFSDSVKTFAQFQEAFPRSRKLDDALWFKALAQLRLEDYRAAQDTLTLLQTRFPRSSLVPQAKYWWARAGQLAGEAAKTVGPRYAQVIDLFPGSFYALLSQARLEELGQTPPPAFPKQASSPEAEVPPGLGPAVALSRAGLFKDAGDEVKAQLQRIRDPDEALKFGHALQQIGQYGSAYSLAARLLWGSAYGEKNPEAVALLYPRAFRRAVEREAQGQKVSAWLLWAIMRRESAFRPEVASSADARGLMQLIPPTAEAIALKLGDKPLPPDALFAPEVNIHYGAWYLARLWDRFRHPALIAAAYNAGPSAVLKWVSQGKSLPLDLFVELIPYKETRGYVKQVVTDFHLYQALYGDSARGMNVVLSLPQPRREGVDF